MRNFTLTQLISPEVLQQIQDAFSDFTGLAALTTNEDGVPVTEGSNFTNFCTNIIRGTPKGLKCCQKCDRQGAIMTMSSGCPEVYSCHAGLVDFAAPIMINDKIIGSFIGGQALTKDLDEDFCRAKAEEYGIDPEVYIAESRKAVRMSPEQVERAAKMIFDISKALSALAVHSFAEIEKSRSLEITARSQSDYIMGVISEIFGATQEYIRTAREAVSSGDAEKMKTALQQIADGRSGAVGMISDSLTYLSMVGKTFRMQEDVYDPRNNVAEVIDNIRRRLEPSGVEISFEISEKIPEFLLGDAGSMCQLIDKAISLSADHGGKIISILVDSIKRCYAEIIKISITTDRLTISDELIDKFNRMMREDDVLCQGEFHELGLSLARSLLHSMSGDFLLKRIGSGAEYIFTIPQLEVRGGDI